MRQLALVMIATCWMLGCASPDGKSRPTPSPTPTGPSADNSSFKLTRVAAGLQSPVYITGAGESSGRLFIVEQVGRIRIVKDGVLQPTPFLDIRSLVASGGERGLLSVAFHPQFKTNGVFIVDYTRASTTPADVGDTVIGRYKATPPNADVADRASGETIQASAPAPGRRSGPTAFAIPGGSASIEPLATSTSRTSARTPGRRSTSSRAAPQAAPTTAGRSGKPLTATAQARQAHPTRSRSRSTPTLEVHAR